MSFDFSIPEKKSKAKPTKIKTMKVRDGGRGKPPKDFLKEENPDIKEMRKLYLNLRKEFMDFKNSFKLRSERKNSAEFVLFLRKKFDIENMSKTDMRVIKKLPNSMNYEEKQAMSGLIRHHGNLDLVLKWINEFLLN